MDTLLILLDFNVSGRRVYWNDVFVIPLRVRIQYNPNIASIEDIIDVKKSLELFVDSLIEVEEFQVKLTWSLRYRAKIWFLRMVGKNLRVNRFEKTILLLKEQGWNHKIGGNAVTRSLN